MARHCGRARPTEKSPPHPAQKLISSQSTRGNDGSALTSTDITCVSTCPRPAHTEAAASTAHCACSLQCLSVASSLCRPCSASSTSSSKSDDSDDGTGSAAERPLTDSTSTQLACMCDVPCDSRRCFAGGRASSASSSLPYGAVAARLQSGACIPISFFRLLSALSSPDSLPAHRSQLAAGSALGFGLGLGGEKQYTDRNGTRTWKGLLYPLVRVSSEAG